MRYLKLVWGLFWLALIVPMLFIAGFLIGIANFENPIKKGLQVVITT